MIWVDFGELFVRFVQ